MLVMMYFKGYSSTWTSSLPLWFFVGLKIPITYVQTSSIHHYQQWWPDTFAILFIIVHIHMNKNFISLIQNNDDKLLFGHMWNLQIIFKSLLTSILIIVMNMRDMRNVNIFYCEYRLQKWLILFFTFVTSRVWN